MDVTKGETFVQPILHNPKNLDIFYILSDPSVLYLDPETKEIEIIGHGTCVIEVHVSGSYSCAICTVNVNDPSVVHSAGFTHDLEWYRTEDEFSLDTWKHTPKYGAAQFVGLSKWATYSNYLVSPEFKLSDKGNTVTIKQGWNNNNPFNELLSRYVVREVGGEWKVLETPPFDISGQFHKLELMIPDELNGKNVQIGCRYTAGGLMDCFWLVKYISVREDDRKDPGFSFNTDYMKVNVAEGEEFVPQVLNNPNNIGVTYTSSNPDVIYYEKDKGIFSVIGSGSTYITATSTATDQYKGKSVSYRVEVTDPFIKLSTGFGDGLRGWFVESTAGTNSWFWHRDYDCAMISVNKNVSGKYDEYLVSRSYWFELGKGGNIMSLYCNFFNHNGCDIKAEVVMREHANGEWCVIDVPFIYDGQPHHYDNITIPKQFSGKYVDLGFRYTADPSTDDYTWAVHSVQIKTWGTDPDFKFDVSEVNYDITSGEEFVSPVLNNPNNLCNIEYSSTRPEVAYYDADKGKVVITGSIGTAVISASTFGNDNFGESTAKCTINVTEPSIIYHTEFATDMGGFHGENGTNGTGWVLKDNYLDRTHIQWASVPYYEDFLISPEITLCNEGNVISTSCCTSASYNPSRIVIREIGGEWVELEVPLRDYDWGPYDNIEIPASFNGKKVQVAFKFVGSPKIREYYWHVKNFTVKKDLRPESGISFGVTEVNFDATKGEKFKAPTLDNPQNANVTVTTSNPEVLYYDVNTKEFKVIGNGSCVVTAEVKFSPLCRNKKVSYTLNVIDPSVVFSAGFAYDLQGGKSEYESWQIVYWDYDGTYGCAKSSVIITQEVYKNYFVSPEITLSPYGNTLSICQAFTKYKREHEINSRVVIREVGGKWCDIEKPTYIVDGQFHDYEGLKIPDSFNGKKVELALLFTADGNVEHYTWAVKHLTVREISRPDPQISFGVTEMKFDANGTEQFVTPELSNPNNVEVTYVSSNPEVAYPLMGTSHIQIIGNGTTVISAVSKANDQYGAGVASFTLNVSDNTSVYAVSFANGTEGFITEGGEPSAWTWNKPNGSLWAKAYGKVSEMTDFYECSPEFTLNEAGNTVELFHGFIGLKDLQNEAQLLIREPGAEWTKLDIPNYGTEEVFSYSGKITIPAQYNGKKVQMGLKYSSDGQNEGVWFVTHMKVNALPAPELSFDVTEVNYDLNSGEEFVAPTLSNPNNVEVTYETSNPSVAYPLMGSDYIIVIGNGTTVITARSKATEQFGEAVATYTINVKDATTVYAVSFANGTEGFLTEGTEPSAWTWNKRNGSLWAEAYGKATQMTDFYVCSPEITLSEAGSTIELFHGYFLMKDVQNEAQLVIREPGAEWTKIDISNYGEEGYFNNSGKMTVPSQYNGKKVQIAFKYASDGQTKSTWFVTHMKVNSIPVNPLSYDVTEVSYDVNGGEKFVAPTLNNPNNLAVTYTSSNPNVAYFVEPEVLEFIGNGTTVITARSAATDSFGEGVASYTLNVKDTTSVYSAGFSDDLQDFYLEGSDVTAWEWDPDNRCITAYAYGKVSEMTDFYLYSPEFTLSETGNTAELYHGFTGLKDPKNQAQLLIREPGGEWTKLNIPSFGPEGNFDYSGIIGIPSQFNGRKVQMALKYSTDGQTNEIWFVNHLKVNSVPSADISYDAAEVNYDVNGGEQFVAPALNNPNNLEVTYESSNPDVAYFFNRGTELAIIGNGTTVITARTAATGSFAEGYATYTLNVTDVNSVYSVSFFNDLGGLAADDAATTAWGYHHGNACITAGAYGRVSEMTDFYLYTPEIKLGDYGNVFDILHGCISVADQSSQMQVLVSEAGGEWVKLNIPQLPEEGYFFSTGGVEIPSQFNGKTVRLALKFASDGKTEGELWFVSHLIVKSVPRPKIWYDVTEVNYDVTSGDEFVAPALNNPDNLAVTYTSNNNNVAYFFGHGEELEIIGNGTTVITATTEDGTTASYTLNVKDEATIYSVSFLDDMGGFVTDDAITAWEYNSDNGCITAYASGKASEKTDFYLYSPEITLSETGNALNMLHGFLSIADQNSQMQVLISEAGGEWTRLNIPVVTEEGYFYYTDYVEIPSQFNGKKVKLALKYSSDGLNPNDIWFVAHLKVKAMASAGISYDVTEVNYELGGGDFEAPILNNPNNVAVTYTSDNPVVAQVDENGAVSIGGDGIAVITATSMSTDKYSVGVASYVLVVTDPEVVYSADFLRSDCGFTPEGDTDAEVWTKPVLMNFIVADGAGKVSEMGDYYYVSPSFTLDGKGNKISFFHIDGAMVDAMNQAQLVVREVGGSWTNLDIVTYPDGQNWTYSGDIEVPEMFNGKDVQIGFKHTTNGTDYAGAWGVAIVKVKRFTPTSIGGATVDFINGNLYDLMGRRVENPSTGVYIQKGRKFVILKK